MLTDVFFLLHERLKEDKKGAYSYCHLGIFHPTQILTDLRMSTYCKNSLYTIPQSHFSICFQCFAASRR